MPRAAARHLARHQVHLEVAEHQPRRIHGAAAPDQRADARHQLGEGERLHQVVVGAAVEAEHAVLHRVARRQHQHRRFQAALTQRGEDLEAAAAGQAEIEQNHVEGLGGDAEEGALPRPLHHHVEFLALEPFAEGVGNFLFVLDDEHAQAGHGLEF